MNTILIKVLSYRSAQQYAVQRTVLAALSVVQEDCPDVTVSIEGIRDVQEILKYTQVFIFPSLVIEEKLVCVGRFPKIEEVVGWLTDTISTKQD